MFDQCRSRPVPLGHFINALEQIRESVIDVLTFIRCAAKQTLELSGGYQDSDGSRTRIRTWARGSKVLCPTTRRSGSDEAGLRPRRPQASIARRHERFPRGIAAMAETSARNTRGHFRSTNLFANLPDAVTNEVIEVLARGRHTRIERIVSHGQASPPGFWYDQATYEWVLVLKGRARLRLEGQPEHVEMGPGDWLNLPPHTRHRVEWTDPDHQTVWLAIHYD